MAAAAQGRLPRGNPGKTGRSAGLKTQAERGKAARVSERLVRKAETVHDKGTAKLNEAVLTGKMAVDAAELVSKLPAEKQDELADEALAKKEGEMRGGRVRSLVKPGAEARHRPEDQRAARGADADRSVRPHLRRLPLALRQQRPARRLARSHGIRR
jgi:hypothetical protein